MIISLLRHIFFSLFIISGDMKSMYHSPPNRIILKRLILDTFTSINQRLITLAAHGDPTLTLYPIHFKWSIGFIIELFHFQMEAFNIS